MRRRKHRRVSRRKGGRFSSKKLRPIGIVRQGGKYHLVMAKVGRGFKTKKGLAKHYASKFGRKR